MGVCFESGTIWTDTRISSTTRWLFSAVNGMTEILSPSRSGVKPVLAIRKKSSVRPKRNTLEAATNQRIGSASLRVY